MDAASLLRMGLTLALLLAVPGLLLWLARRLGWRLPGPVGGGQRLRIVARTAIDQRHCLILIRRDAAEQLLLVGPNGTTILDPAIRLSAEDRDEQSRLAAEQAARVAATEAAMAAARARVEARARFMVARVRRLVARAQDKARPGFAALVDRARLAPAAAPPTEPPAITSARARTPVPRPAPKPARKPAAKRRPRPRPCAARA